MAKQVVSYAESQAIVAFLTYLNKHFSSRINQKDTFLIIAVSAWFHQESGGLSKVIGNNPFNIRQSPFATGYRQTNGNGKFAVFASMADGFRAAAYLLIHGGHGPGKGDSDSYGYRLALKAMMKGGNQGAWEFLAALAMSSWDAAHYGAANWQEAFSDKTNHLLRNYLTYSGVQLVNPHPKPEKPRPELPRDFNFKATPNNFIDPWAAKDLYDKRHRPVMGSVAGTTLKR